MNKFNVGDKVKIKKKFYNQMFGLYEYLYDIKPEDELTINKMKYYKKRECWYYRVDGEKLYFSEKMLEPVNKSENITQNIKITTKEIQLFANSFR